MKLTDIDYIKESELSDVIDLRRLSFLAVAPEHYNPQEIENLIGDYNVAQFASMIENYSFFCVRRDHKIIATAGWDADRICHVYVIPSLFKNDIGTKLVEHVVTDYFARTTLNEMKADIIISARGFYEKCGFHVQSVEKAWDGRTYFLMEKKRPAKKILLTN